MAWSVRTRSAALKPADQALGRRLGGDRERVGKALGGIVAGPRDDGREQAGLLLGLHFERLFEDRGAGAVGAAFGEDDGLRRARLQHGGDVGPACLDDRIGAGRAQSFDDIARRLIGNDGEGTLQRHRQLCSGWARMGLSASGRRLQNLRPILPKCC